MTASGHYQSAGAPVDVRYALPGWSVHPGARLATVGREPEIFLLAASMPNPNELDSDGEILTESYAVAAARANVAEQMRFDPTWYWAAQGPELYEHRLANIVPSDAEVPIHLQRFLRAHTHAGIAIANGWVICYLPSQPLHRTTWPAEMLAQLLAGWPEPAPSPIGHVMTEVARS